MRGFVTNRRHFELQLACFGGNQFELGIKNPIDGRMSRGTVTKSEIDRRFKYYQYRNANGDHIYVRPFGSEAIVLVDDLSSDALLALKSDGFTPCCVVLTSPNNYQAWVKLGQTDVGASVLTTVGGLLADRYHADAGSKDFRHLGRAVGFTNRKLCHRQADGKYPFVEILESTGMVAVRGREVLREAEKHLAATRAGEQSRVCSIRNSSKELSLETYLERVSLLASRYATPDMSRIEATVSVKLLRDGVHERSLREMMLLSDDIQERKRGHVADYVDRTIRYALSCLGESNVETGLIE